MIVVNWLRWEHHQRLIQQFRSSKTTTSNSNATKYIYMELVVSYIVRSIIHRMLLIIIIMMFVKIFLLFRISIIIIIIIIIIITNMVIIISIS